MFQIIKISIPKFLELIRNLPFTKWKNHISSHPDWKLPNLNTLRRRKTYSIFPREAYSLSTFQAFRQPAKAEWKLDKTPQLTIVCWMEGVPVSEQWMRNQFGKKVMRLLKFSTIWSRTMTVRIFASHCTVTVNVSKWYNRKLLLLIEKIEDNDEKNCRRMQNRVLCRPTRTGWDDCW